jgi:hypothetical protein
MSPYVRTNPSGIAHGLTAGTDETSLWALLFYAGSAWLVLALLLYRVGLRRPEAAGSS